MRILFSSTKGLGHLRPLLPYALKAQSRGHSVCVATPDGAGPTLKGLGLAHAPFAAPADDDVKAVTAPWQGLPAEEFVVRFVKKVFADLRPRAALPALRQSIHEWRPDLVVRKSAEFAAAIVAEEAGLPHARVAPHCGTAEMGLIALAAEPIDAIRRETGLKPDEGFALRAAQGFSGFPASLDGAEPAHLGPPPFRVRESPQPTRRDGRPAPWAESDGRPLLYISFGTEAGSSANTRAPYRLVVETVSDMPVRALLTTGPNINASSLGPPPANVAIEAWVPQGEVWPHATAFLCHGGSGTLLGGLAEGLPVVVLPLFADQPLNGRNVEAAGAGLALLDPDAASLRSAIERVLVDGGMRTAARRIADEMAAMHSVDEAIDELECVASRQNVG